jgi:hypothetical protein
MKVTFSGQGLIPAPDSVLGANPSLFESEKPRSPTGLLAKGVSFHAAAETYCCFNVLTSTVAPNFARIAATRA